MPSTSSSPPAPAPHTAAGAGRVALSGLIALAVAMGIGRFAFTPIMPIMLRDGVVDLHGATWLATANYLGYFGGAVLCTLQPMLWARRPRLAPIATTTFVRAGLAATVALTLAMALPRSSAWPLLRFAAGVASAFVLVHSSAWCLARLADLDRSALGGVMFAGPGAGIVASGVVAYAVVAWHGSATTAWLVFAALALALSATVWPVFGGAARGSAAAGAASPATSTAPATSHSSLEVGCLAFAYGIAGFGYIVTATFLPVIARAALPGSPWLDFFWPVFGGGIVVGSLLTTWLRTGGDLRLLLAGGYLMQALGIAIGLGSPTLLGFTAGSLLVGMPFTTLTLFALREARRLRPRQAASTMGLLTTVYGIGQIAGPPMVGQMLHLTGDPHRAFTLSLSIASTSLGVGALVYVVMWRLWPRRAEEAGATAF